MKILAIDTSGLQAGAAIVSADVSKEIDNAIVIGEIFLNARTGEKSWTHSEILMPGVDFLFKSTGLQPCDINYVAYTNGPGSFTGLRIGASSAIAMAHALNKPAISVPTLDAFAYNISYTENIVIPMLDARRGQVYTALYKFESGKLFRKTDYLALPVEELFSRAKNLVQENSQSSKIIFLGDGADANKSAILQTFPDAVFPGATNNRQRASAVAAAALDIILANPNFQDEVELLYIRAPQAVREALAK